MSIASGLEWQNIGPSRPPEGRELTASDPDLAKALTSKLMLTQEEWDAIGIRDLRKDDFIKSGDSYFKPVHKGISLPHGSAEGDSPWNMSDPFVCLLLRGGYIYLDEEYDVVAINSFYFKEVNETMKKEVGSTSVINLGWCSALPEKSLERLKSTHRFQPVTVPWLNALGYTDFAWVCPSEVLGDSVFPRGGRVRLLEQGRKRMPFRACGASRGE